LSIIVIIAVALFFILRFIIVGQASRWSIRSIVYIVLIAIAGAIVLTLFASGTPQPPSKSISNGMIVSAYRGVVIAWSPDSTHLAIGLSDGTVREWNTQTGEHILKYYSGSGLVTSLAWSPNGTYIASGYDNGTIQIWNATTGQKLFSYLGHTNPVVAIAWSSDSMRIASASEGDKMVRVWQAGPLTGQLEDRIKLVITVAAIIVLIGGLLVAWRYRRRTRSETQKRIDAVALVLLVLASSIGVALLITQLAQFPLFRRLPTLGTTIATHQGNALTWSPDATRIASTSGDGTIQVWNVATGSTILTHSSSKQATFSVTWSPDGKYLASGHNDGIVQVWNAANGHTIFTNEGHSNAVRAVAWSPDAAQIASAADDNTMQVWDALTGHHQSGYHLDTYPGHGEIIAWSPDGTYLASANLTELVQVRQMYEKIDQYMPFQRQINRDTLSFLLFCDAALLIAFTLATSFHIVQSFLWKTKRIQAAFIVAFAILICVVNVAQNMMQHVTHYSSAPHPIGRTALYKYTGVTVTWAPDGKHFATAINDSNRVFIRDTARGDLSFIYRNHLGTVQTLAWSPDGVHIASGYADGSIQIWEAATGKNLLTYHGHTKEIFAQSWSPDSTRIISVSEDQTAQIWNALTGQLLFAVHHGFSWLGTHVSWSPDGRYVTIADNDWQILDGISGRVVYHINALGASDGAWAPDGKHIALSFDSGAFLAVGIGHTIYFSREARDSIYTLSWSPDSKYIAAGTSSGLIEIWDARTAKLAFSYDPYCMFMEKLAWSSDGKHIASACSGDSDIQIWQL
jgi:WD40 repeat protein